MKPLQPIVGLCLLLGSLFGEIGPTPGTQPIWPVFAQADLVCNCTIESLQVLDERRLERAGKVFTLRHVVATVKINDVYNKQPSGLSPIHVKFEEEVPLGASLPVVSKPETALMFLKASSQSLYEYSDRFIGAVPFKTIPLQSGEPGLPKLEAALREVVRTGSQDDRINAMRLLEGFNQLSSETLQVLDSASGSVDLQNALSALAVLIRAKQPGSIQKLATYLRTHKIVTPPVAVLSIGSELRRVNDPNDLIPLEDLTSSDILSIQFGAMVGLRNIKSPQSIPILLQRLDDSNSDIQFFAVIALSEILQLGGDYAPTMYSFDQNPNRYTTLWKNWAKSQGYLN